MTENDQQYQVTKTCVEKFESALADLVAAPNTTIRKAQIDAVRSVLDELKQEMLKTCVEKFESALADLVYAQSTSARRVQIAVVRTVLTELKQELAEYENTVR